MTDETQETQVNVVDKTEEVKPIELTAVPIQQIRLGFAYTCPECDKSIEYVAGLNCAPELVERFLRGEQIPGPAKCIACGKEYGLLLRKQMIVTTNTGPNRHERRTIEKLKVKK